MSQSRGKSGLAGRLASYFIDSRLTPIMVIASILLGIFAVLALPREEEPQIQVPMVDISLRMPGASADEVSNRLTRPVEQLLWEVEGVEYLYSTTQPGGALVIVRFGVGTELEGALVRLHRRLDSAQAEWPAAALPALVQPRTIDDVPVLALTLHSSTQDPFVLRQLGRQLEESIKSVSQVAETRLIGGLSRELRVQIDPARLSAYQLTVGDLQHALLGANRAEELGRRSLNGESVLLQAGRFLGSPEELRDLVVAVRDDRPVYLGDVATIVDGPADPDQYVLHLPGSSFPAEAAVTLTVAKRRGSNAIEVVERVLEKVETLKGTLLPADVSLTVTRDYGHTAAQKSNELLLHMGIAVFGVAMLILFFLGWRESLVILVAIPSTLALTLLVFFLYGYTLNRITLFALIFSIGILVDDAIVVVENIVRHLRLPGGQGKPLREIAVEAVDEVGNPTILATWAVIAAILPMAFVGGLMGPYMRPIPIGASAAMIFSLIVAFTITPWAAIRVIRRHVEKPAHGDAGAGESDTPNDWFTRLYHRVVEPMLDHAFWRWTFLGAIVALLLGSLSLVALGIVEVKMLPFDNKSEFQVIIDPAEGTPLERTTAIAMEMATAISGEPEVRDIQVYAGTSGPFNFNGLVRHYYARRGDNVADLQVNLVGRSERNDQSHAIASRLRPKLAAIAERHGAAMAVAEVPPGPPVLQTLVMEVHAPTPEQRVALAAEVRRILRQTEGVVDLDWYVEDARPQIRYLIDRQKAAHHGLAASEIAQILQLAGDGIIVDTWHDDHTREDIQLRLEVPDRLIADDRSILDLTLRNPRRPDAPQIPLSELVMPEEETVEPFIYRKNLQPVTYVTADVSGAVESPIYALLAMAEELRALRPDDFGGVGERMPIHHLSQPFDERQPAIKWDGEWHITLEVFRDLGIAFAVVLVLIAMLMVGWFKSYITPLVVMSAIPFSLVGILPAHWALGAFFTATSMIGFMAGAGIVVRNSIILVDFIEMRRRHGLSLRDAVVEAGAVRFRPMLLTALAVVVGAGVILPDPIFQGLAISLMFGEMASLLISRMAVPVLYFMVNARRRD